MAMRWYVIHAYSGFEKKVAQSIEEQARQLGMEDMIDQVMVPTEEVVEMRRGAKINAETLQRGLFSRVRGDAYFIAPPIVTNNDTIDRIIEIVAESTKVVLG